MQPMQALAQSAEKKKAGFRLGQRDKRFGAQECPGVISAKTVLATGGYRKPRWWSGKNNVSPTVGCNLMSGGTQKLGTAILEATDLSLAIFSF